MQITLQFFPNFERQFEEMVFVDVEGRSGRMPVLVRGTGRGPCATLAFDVLDVGNTYIHTPHHYEVSMDNRGEVPVPFHVVASGGPLAHAFTVEPPAATVGVEQSQTLAITLQGDRLGKFDEKLLLAVDGTDAQLSLQVKGRVVGPTFRVSAEALDFGTIAYGFRCACVSVSCTRAYKLAAEAKLAVCKDARFVSLHSEHISVGREPASAPGFCMLRSTVLVQCSAEQHWQATC